MIGAKRPHFDPSPVHDSVETASFFHDNADVRQDKECFFVRLGVSEDENELRYEGFASTCGRVVHQIGALQGLGLGETVVLPGKELADTSFLVGGDDGWREIRQVCEPKGHISRD